VQELSEHLGLRKLNEKLNDPMMQDSFEGIFPKDNPKNTRFAINFFTSIGLGGITDSLREYLKNMPRLIMQQQRQVESESGSEESSEESDISSSGGSESDSSDSGSSSSDSESDSESESESEPENKKRRKK
jgi:pre-mRNA-splicing factor CWC22